MLSYTVPYIPNSKEIASAVPEIQVSETHRTFFVFSSSSHQTIDAFANYVLVHQISTKFGTQVALPKPYIFIKFGMIWSKIDENISNS